MIFPLIVIVFKKSKLAFASICIAMIIGSSAILAYNFYTYHLTVGTLSFEDYYLFGYIFQKPTGQSHGTAFGFLMGWLYLNILKYWALTDAEKPSFRIIYTFHTKFWPSFIICFLGFVLFNTVLFLPYDPNNDAYSWTRT